MPTFHRAHSEVGLLHVAYGGQIATKDVLYFFDRYEEDIQRHPDFSEFCDSATSFRTNELYWPFTILDISVGTPEAV